MINLSNQIEQSNHCDLDYESIESTYKKVMFFFSVHVENKGISFIQTVKKVTFFYNYWILFSPN